MKSSVSVEAEVSTSEESVDMEAESTKMITMPIRISGSVDSMEGTIASYRTEPSALYSAGESNSRPNPPRK